MGIIKILKAMRGDFSIFHNFLFIFSNINDGTDLKQSKLYIVTLKSKFFKEFQVVIKKL